MRRDSRWGEGVVGGVRGSGWGEGIVGRVKR